jgi:hypothetical protein
MEQGHSPIHSTDKAACGRQIKHQAGHSARNLDLPARHPLVSRRTLNPDPTGEISCHADNQRPDTKPHSRHAQLFTCRLTRQIPHPKTLLCVIAPATPLPLAGIWKFSTAVIHTVGNLHACSSASVPRPARASWLLWMRSPIFYPHLWITLFVRAVVKWTTLLPQRFPELAL